MTSDNQLAETATRNHFGMQVPNHLPGAATVTVALSGQITPKAVLGESGSSTGAAARSIWPRIKTGRPLNGSSWEEIRGNVWQCSDECALFLRKRFSKKLMQGMTGGYTAFFCR